MSLTQKLIWILFFSLIFLGTRIPRLSNDLVNTDEVYWHNRSLNFTGALETRNFSETYQKYHPGVTLMWVMTLTSEGISLVSGVPTQIIFNDFEFIHYYSKLSLIALQLCLSLYAIYLLSQILGFKKGFFSVFIFSFEPFFIGNSRLLHLDAQITLYLLISLSLAYLNLKSPNISRAILSGIFLSLAALTKTLFLGCLVYILLYTLLHYFFKKDIKVGLKIMLTTLLSFVSTYFLFFPALWVEPLFVFRSIMIESFEMGEMTGHKQIFFGVLDRNPGFWFYPVVYAIKLSLITHVGVLLAFVYSIKDLYLRIRSIKNIKNTKSGSFIKETIDIKIKNISFYIFVFIFYLGYFIILTIFDKKVDRYLIEIFPFFSLVSVYGYSRIKFQKFLHSVLLFCLLMFSVVYPYKMSFPHLMTYINPIFGDANDGNKIIGQRLFGIGVYELREYMLTNYGPNQKIGIHEPGPFRSIYPGRRTYDILKVHPNSIKFMIIGINNDIPIGISRESSIRWKHIDSIYINGLEFWKIYKKIG